MVQSGEDAPAAPPAEVPAAAPAKEKAPKAPKEKKEKAPKEKKEQGDGRSPARFGPVVVVWRGPGGEGRREAGAVA